MKRDDLLISDVGLDEVRGKSRMPALLDLAKSASGLLLVLFLAAHLLFESSILLGKDAMYAVTKAFEGEFLFAHPQPWLVSVAALAVIVLFVVHAWLAMRKFPASHREHKTLLAHRRALGHRDTTLWFVQVYTGFALFFLGSAHLFFVLVNPGLIGPYASSDRVWGGMWPVYLLLLLAAVVHGGVGLYRLAVKWGWPAGSDPDASRRSLARATWSVTAIFLLLGLASLAAYMKIGYEHRHEAGERYAPAAAATSPAGTQRQLTDSEPPAAAATSVR